MALLSNTLRIECPKCHKFTTLKKSSGVYSGKCKHCKPGVRFSVIALSIISKKDVKKNKHH